MDQQIRYHPKIFMPEMILAILNDRKNQTRRVISKQNSLFDGGPWPSHMDYIGQDSIRKCPFDFNRAWIGTLPSPDANLGPCLKLPWPEQNTIHRIYPRIKKNDRIWVKENWRIKTWTVDTITIEYQADKASKIIPIINDMMRQQVKKYAAKTGWIPSIFMFAWANRINLEVTKMRVECIQNINRADAIAEGLPTGTYFRVSGNPEHWFKVLWNNINADRGYGWDKNPWVWVIEFKRV